ncbi:MAG TPA: SdpI family protein [Ktedonobacteraceae bacterium]|jgi:hypothetical protein|nr:SdpI family protein [Ktedonobacteraceae bacterium]
MPLINTILGVLDIGTGLLCIVISIPLLRGSVPRNPCYGFRFRQSCESEAKWQQINTYGAKRLIYWSMLIVGMGIGTFFLPLQDNLVLIMMMAIVPPLIVLIPVWETYQYTRSRK